MSQSTILPRPGGRSAPLKALAGVPREAWGQALLVAAAYYLGAKLGFAFTFQPHPISTLWLPNALLLAALLLTPVSSWWVLLAGALPAHLAAELQSGVPLTMVLGWFASNSAEALIGAVCIRRFCASPLRFLSNVLAAMIVVPFVVTWANGGIAAIRGASLRTSAEAAALFLCLLAVG